MFSIILEWIITIIAIIFALMSFVFISCSLYLVTTMMVDEAVDTHKKRKKHHAIKRLFHSL